MAPSEEQNHGYVNVAEVEIDAVQPGRAGFVLSGRGEDRADYRIEIELEMPVDDRTRAVLAELLAQSEWRIQRRAHQPFRPIRPKSQKRSTA